MMLSVQKPEGVDPLHTLAVLPEGDDELTVCGRSVRKSFIQAHVRAGRPSVSIFVMRMSGMIVLKAEL